MPLFPIVDAHVHLCDPARFRYPWLEDLPDLKKSFLLSDYRQAHGLLPVEAIVFVQCDVEASQGMNETRWVIDMARRDPRIKAIIPWVPLEKGRACRPILDELAQSPLVKGVRRLIQPESALDFCLQQAFIDGVCLLAEYGFSFDICISHTQMANATEMVSRCPDTRFILDHIGKPDIKNAVWEPWATDLETLSKLPNVTCKISGIVTEANHESWCKEDIKPYIEHVINCFGFDRVMYGGDWPVVTLAATYLDWVEALERALEGCSLEDRKRLFNDNAVRIYMLDDETSGGHNEVEG